MSVRGWLIIGGAGASTLLPPDRGLAGETPVLPRASDFAPGRWIVWRPTPWEAPVTVVVVEIPLAP